MKNIFTLCTWITLSISTNTFAQQLKKETTTDSSYWQLGLTFQNDNVYLGRKDSTRLPYLTPLIGYYDKSGLFIDGSLSYLTAKNNNRIDLVTIEGGYNYSKNNVDFQILGAKYFYNSNSTSVRSEVKASIDAYAAYDFDFIKPSFEVTGSFGKKSDIDLTLGLEHSFYALEDKFDITPTALVNAGTRNYYDSYSNKKSLGGLRKKKTAAGTNAYTITTKVEGASALKFLDYEFTLPVNYTYHKVIFNFTPTYAVPLNPAMLLTNIKTSNTVAYSGTTMEKLGNICYYSLGVVYKF